MKARIIVTLKTGVLDPQGKAIEAALTSFGYRVSTACDKARSSTSRSRRQTARPQKRR